jgi:transposase
VFRWPNEAVELVQAYSRANTGENPGKNALAALATRLVAMTGHPRDACLRFLHQCGLKPKRNRRAWTRPEQQRLLDLLETLTIPEIAKLLQRSQGSIRSMLHRLGESAQRGRDWFTPYSLAEALHIRVEEVQRWIKNGWLACRVIENSGLQKRVIDPDNFSQFVKQYGAAVMGRRLNADGLWFVQNFVFPPKHAHLLPLRKSKDMPPSETETDDAGQDPVADNG